MIMKKQDAIKVFEDKKVRTLWNEENEKWYFSIIDVIAVLTDALTSLLAGNEKEAKR